MHVSKCKMYCEPSENIVSHPTHSAVSNCSKPARYISQENAALAAELQALSAALEENRSGILVGQVNACLAMLFERIHGARCPRYFSLPYTPHRVDRHLRQAPLVVRSTRLRQLALTPARRPLRVRCPRCDCRSQTAAAMCVCAAFLDQHL